MHSRQKIGFQPPKQIGPATSTQSSSLTKPESLSKAETLATHQQSVAVLIQCLNVSFGIIMYQRKILPEESFFSTDLESIFAAYNIPRRSKKDESLVETADALPQVKQLNPGYSPESAIIDHALSSGVPDAISKGYLKSLVLLICIDKDNREDVVETWTFNFSYLPNGVNIDVTGTPKTAEPSNFSIPTAMTPIEARKSTRRFIRRLVPLCKGLDDLPYQKYIDLKMLYTDITPANYEPQGFKSSTGDSLTMTTFDIGDVPQWKEEITGGTGQHAVSVQMMSILRCFPLSMLKPDTVSIADDPEEIPPREVVWDAEIAVHQRRQLEGENHVNPFTAVDPTRAAAARSDSVYRQPLGRRTNSGQIAIISSGAVADTSQQLDPNNQGDFGPLYGSDTSRRQESRHLPGWTQILQSQQSDIEQDRTLPLDVDSVPFLGQTHRPPVPRDVSGPLEASKGTVLPLIVTPVLSLAKNPLKATPASTKNQSAKTQTAKCIKRKALPHVAEQDHDDSPQIRRKPKKMNAAKSALEPVKTKSSIQHLTKMKSKEVLSPVREPAKGAKVKPSSPSKPSKPKNKSAQTVSTAPEVEGDDSMDCYCRQKIKGFSGEFIVKCKVCAAKHHSFCVGALSSASSPDSYQCLSCVAREAKHKDSSYDATTRLAAIQGLARFRRALIVVSREGGLYDRGRVQRLIGADDMAMDGVVERLTAEKFVERSTRRGQQPQKWIRSDKRSPTWQRYFTPGGEVEEEAVGVTLTKTPSTGQPQEDKSLSSVSLASCTSPSTSAANPDAILTPWSQLSHGPSGANSSQMPQVINLPHRFDKSSRLLEMQDVGWSHVPVTRNR